MPDNTQFLLSIYWMIPYLLIASISGIIFSVIGLYNRFGPDFKRIISSYSGISYLILSAFGASLFTLSMKTVGVNMIKNDYLDYILMSMIGAGLFLGIISKIAVHEQINDNLTKIKTLSDYIYDALNDSMKRKIDEDKGEEIRMLLTEYDVADLVRPLDGSSDGRGVLIQLVDTSSYLTEKDKNMLRLLINNYASQKNYAALLFELTKSETNITVKRLISFLENSGVKKKVNRATDGIRKSNQSLS
jgi:hypothetical protein